MEPHRSSSDSSAASNSPHIPRVGCYDAGLFLNTDDGEAQQVLEPSKLQPWLDLRSSDFEQHQGAEYAGTATDENCSNNRADSAVSGTHRHNTRSGGTKAVNSSQQITAHSFKRRKDEQGRFRKQEHSSINRKSIQGASCSTLPWAMGETMIISNFLIKLNHNLKGRHIQKRAEAEGMHAKTSLSMGKIVDEVTTARVRAFVSNFNHRDVSQGTSKSHPMPGSDDTQNLIDYFNNMMIKDPFFFYTVKVEAALGMTNFFWRDSRSKLDYMHFGDVLVLDTSRINKSDMICAAFWGLNHHRQPIIYGCAVLVDQTVGSFRWLLQNFLKAMSGKKPRTVITDVSEAIANALSDVFPETRHCLPAWSILSNFSKYLPSLIDLVDQSSIADLFGDCVFNVHSQEEFESKWSSFIGKTKLHEDPWFASLYRTREKWSHAFTKNVFSAGLLSIGNYENSRGVLGNLFCKTMTLYQIALWCGEVAKHMRGEELKEDRHCKRDIKNLKSRSPVEKEAERLYTRLIFEMFQGELFNSISLAIEESEVTATCFKFKLTEEGSTKVETVEFNTSNLTLACSCGKFESVGILCFHALKVLNFKNIFKIPPRYLLKRWTKSAKDNLPVVSLSTGIARDRIPVMSFYTEFMGKALQVAHMCTSKKRKIIASTSVCSALGEIAKAPRTEERQNLLKIRSNDDMGQSF